MLFRSSFMLLFALGCNASVGFGDSGTSSRSHPRNDRDDTGAETIEPAPDTATTDTDTIDDDGDQDAVFDLSFVHQIELTVDGPGMRSLGGDPYTYVEAALSFDGEERPAVGLRIKGRLGSLRSVGDKPAFKVDLLEYDGERLHGIEKFNLNNMVQDCAKVHELASYGIHRMVGIPAPRVAYARVYLNGEDQGLYSLVEDYDDVFLDGNFKDPSGNLYDGDYYLWNNGSYTLVDFDTSTEQYFELDEGTDVGMSDIEAVTTALASGNFQGQVGAVVDLDQHADFLAVAAWTGHYDSYSYYSNNYRVYFDPARDGKAVLLPWDPDWAFYASTALNSPYGDISLQCMRDTTCMARVRETADTLSATVPDSELQDEIEAAAALILPELESDPELDNSLSEIRGCQQDLYAWFTRRGGELDAAGF